MFGICVCNINRKFAYVQSAMKFKWPFPIQEFLEFTKQTNTEFEYDAIFI